MSFVRSVFLRVLVIVVSLFLVVRLVSVLHSYRASYNEYQNELKKKEQYQDNIAELRSLCSDESKNKMIEKAARERFGFAYPNEEFYTDSTGN